jgi:hypothetical protein
LGIPIGGLVLIQMGAAFDGGFCCVCGLREPSESRAGADVGPTEANAREIVREMPGLALPTWFRPGSSRGIQRQGSDSGLSRAAVRFSASLFRDAHKAEWRFAACFC